MLATTEPEKLEPLPADPPSASSFVGTYVGLYGCVFEFEGGKFSYCAGSDAGPQTLLFGYYDFKNELVSLDFEGPPDRNYDLYPRVVDGVHLLVSEWRLSEFEKGEPFSDDLGHELLILKERSTTRYADWWETLLKQHPGFAERLPQSIPESLLK